MPCRARPSLNICASVIFLSFHAGTLRSTVPHSMCSAPAPSLSSSGMATLGADQALALRLIKSPQDAHADVVVKLAIAPSYVTYLPK